MAMPSFTRLAQRQTLLPARHALLSAIKRRSVLTTGAGGVPSDIVGFFLHLLRAFVMQITITY